MSVILPFIFFAVLNTGMLIITKRKFGAVLPITLMSSALLVYFSQFIFKTFDVGYYILILMALVSLIVLIKKRREQELIERVLSNGFYSYIVISILIIIIDYGRHYVLWDEFSHCGKMVKEMMRIGRFYTELTSNLMAHKDYPPLVGVFELLVCKLQGGYSEMGTTMGIHLMELALLCPWLTEKFESVGKKWYEGAFNLILFVVVELMIVFVFDSQPQEIVGIFPTIYTDLLLIFIYTYGISIVIDEKEANSLFGYIALLISSVSMILTKQIGIAFILLVTFFYALNTFFNSPNKSDIKKSWYKKLLASFGIVVISMTNYMMWSSYVKSVGKIQQQFSLERIKIGEIIAIINGGGSELRSDTYKRYVKALFIQKINVGFLSISYFLAAFIAIGILVLIYISAKGRFKKKDFINTLLLFICGNIGYAFTMFVMYMFCFSEREMTYLIGYHRYMGTYILSEYLILFFIAVSLLSGTIAKQLSWKKILPVFVVFLLVSAPTKLVDLSPQILRGEPEAAYREKANYISNCAAGTGTGRKYLFLISSDNAKNTYYLNYYLNEIKVDGRYISKDIANYSLDDEAWDEIVNDLKEDEYLYVMNTSESVDKILGKYTKEGLITDETLYEVKVENGELSLLKAE